MGEETKQNQQVASQPDSSTWRGTHVYLMAAVCLALGVVVGYLVRGSDSTVPTAQMAPAAKPVATAPAQQVPANTPPTLEQMKQMAEKTASPVLEKIKSDPNNFAALNDAGNVYRATHQFKEAATYYQRALKIKPQNSATRTDLASCLYYTGDVDGALAQLDKALSYDPKFFGALLNKGIIELRAKNDVAGAISSWEKIVKTTSDPQQKLIAEKLISAAKQKAASETESEAK